jgi:16S rRNA (adenine1518-N6/adenine1519-N6)-dimethyltransferase
MKLTEMREVLERRDIQLTKSLGQNFLHDGNQLRRIVDAAELTKADKVLEIGPGLGPLTELLLEKTGEVFAIEKDGRLVDFLCERFGLKSEAEETTALTPSLSPGERETMADALVIPTLPDSAQCGNDEPPLLSAFASSSGAIASKRSGDGGERAGVRENEANNFSEDAAQNLGLLHDDALDFLKRERRDWTDWKLVANLPYSVASPVLVELAQARGCPERMVATLQLEVARRLMATADDDDYGVLTLLVQLNYEPREWFKIPASCFFPAPDVDSACVVLVRRAKPLLADEQRAAFVKIVKRAFSQRRKMMLKLLKQDWPAEKLAAAFEKLKISPQERAEKLSLVQFIQLTRHLLNSVGDEVTSLKQKNE